MCIRRFLIAAILVFTAACSEPAPKGPVPIASLPDINTAAVLADIKKLSSDEFEGRLPGTNGEQLTVAYLVDQFKAAGLEPGNPDGTWVQKVPLVGLTPQFSGPLVVKKGGVTKTFKVADEFVAIQPAGDR